MRPCFTFKAKAGDKPAILAIDDEIGFWGTQAKDFRASLNAVADNELHVDINSPGGDVFAGLGMYNMLRSWATAQDGRTLVTRVTGVAASMASIVALAGDRREMPANAFAMVHAASSGVWGTADEIRDHADTVDKISASLRSIYVDRMGVDEAKAVEMMSKDTWLTADEAKAVGFATDIVGSVEATAKFDLDRADLPAQIAALFKAKADDAAQTDAPAVTNEPAQVEVPDTPVAEQIVALAKTQGLEAHGAFFAVSFDSLDKAKERMTAARDIVALCGIAKAQPEFAAKAIREGKGVEDVRAALIADMAAQDEKSHTSSARTNESKGKDGAVSSNVNPTAIWNSHNAQAKKDSK